MSRRVRRNHSPALKAKVALAAIKGKKTLADMAKQFDVHRNQIAQCRSQLIDGVVGVSEAKSEATAPAIDVRTLHASDELRLRRGRGTGVGERYFVRRARAKVGLLGEKR